MAKLFCCRLCRVEMAPIALADGRAVLLCVDCDLIGHAHEVARGATMRTAGLRATKRRRSHRLTTIRRGAKIFR
jgi:hypothetical protein